MLKNVPGTDALLPLTDDDLKQVEGRKDKLVGKIQERYGSTREEAEKQADDWLGKHG